MYFLKKINIEFIRKRCKIHVKKRGNYFIGVAEVRLTGVIYESGYHKTRTQARLGILSFLNASPMYLEIKEI